MRGGHGETSFGRRRAAQPGGDVGPPRLMRGARRVSPSAPGCRRRRPSRPTGRCVRDRDSGSSASPRSSCPSRRSLRCACDTAGRVAGMTRRAAIEIRSAPRRDVFGDVGCAPFRAERGDKVGGVVRFVRAERRRPPAARFVPPHQPQGLLALGVPSGPRHAQVHTQPVPILHEDVEREGELRLLPRALASEQRIAVGDRGVGGVGAPLPVEVHGRVPRIVRRRPIRRARPAPREAKYEALAQARDER
jgi:hypothetical protein